MGGAAAVQANWIWLISGTTVTLNFLKKSMPKMGPVKSLPWNCAGFLMKPQEGIGCPSAPLRRGPDGLEFWLQGTIFKDAPVSTRYLSFVNSSVRKINPALTGKCIAVAVACVGMAAQLKVVRRLVSFPTKHRAKHTCEPCGYSSCEIYRCHYQGFGRNKNQGRKGVTFRMGIAILFVTSLPAVGSREPTVLSQGSCDCGVMATSSIPQGVSSLHHGCSRCVGASSYRFSHGRR
jgi:hypothetical protein